VLSNASKGSNAVQGLCARWKAVYRVCAVGICLALAIPACTHYIGKMGLQRRFGRFVMVYISRTSYCTMQFHDLKPIDQHWDLNMPFADCALIAMWAPYLCADVQNDLSAYGRMTTVNFDLSANKLS
jgi:hypothetical protein